MARLVQKVLAILLTFWVSSAMAEVRISDEGMDRSAPMVNLTERTLKAANAVNAVAAGLSDIEILARDVQAYFGPMVEATGGGGPVRVQQDALADWMLNQLPIADLPAQSAALRRSGPVPLKVDLPPIDAAPVANVDMQALPAMGPLAGPVTGALDGVQDFGPGMLDNVTGGVGGVVDAATIGAGGAGGALPPVPLLGAN